MKILFLSYDGMTDPLGQSQVIPYLQGLSEAGHQVWIISFDKPDRFSNGKEAISQILRRSNIHWLPQVYTSKPPVLSTIKDIRTMRSVAYELIKKETIDALHCRSYIAALVGQSAKKKFGTRFIFDMRGFWADERVDGGLWNLKNPIFKTIYTFFKIKEKQFLLEADAVVSLTQNAADEIHSWNGFDQVPITVIPCCADLSLFTRPDEHTIAHLRKELGIPSGSFVLSYLGSLGTWYMLPEMMAFFKELLNVKPDAYFFFITGDDSEMVHQEAQRLSIPQERCIVKRANRAEVPLFASVSNASIFFIRPLYSKKASSPTKMGELMSLGIPLICNDQVGDVEAILQDGGTGLVVRAFDEQAFQKALNQLDVMLSADPTKSIQCAYRHYALGDGIKSYHGIYAKL